MAGDYSITVAGNARPEEQRLTRSARHARIGGTVLVVLGIVGLALSVWLNWLDQDRIDDEEGLPTTGFFPDDEDVDWVDRLEHFALRRYFDLPALTLATGLGLRLVADYTTARAGGPDRSGRPDQAGRDAVDPGPTAPAVPTEPVGPASAIYPMAPVPPGLPVSPVDGSPVSAVDGTPGHRGGLPATGDAHLDHRPFLPPHQA